VLAKSRTGSGKTLAFAIPIVETVEPSMTRPAALVLVPPRELAVQVTEEMHDVAASRNLRVAPVYGGARLEKQAARAAKAHVVVATPGRLTDLMNRKLLSVNEIKILILDEADRMLDMGFQPQVDRIVARVPKKRQTMFFSATLDGVVGYAARAYTQDPVLHEIVDKRMVIEEADHRFVQVDEHGKLEKLLEVLAEERDLTLVFVRTKRGADRLRARLRAKRVPAAALDASVALRFEHFDEEAAAGYETWAGFLQRRLAPAMRTCRSVQERQENLSGKLSRATTLLRSWIDVEVEKQNRDLLASMNRRARLQLRLQQTVEGLSVAAVSYYVVGLIGYVVRGSPAAEFVRPEIVTAVSVPFVVVAIWLLVRRIRRVHADDGGDRS
jgi:hypothetical protein